MTQDTSGVVTEAAPTGEAVTTAPPLPTPTTPVPVAQAIEAAPVWEAKVEQPEPAASNPNTPTGAHGMALPEVGELAGGNIARTLEAPPAKDDSLGTSMALQRRALMSSVAQKIAPFVGRPVSEWGLIGEGDTVKGQSLLLDLNTGEKVRALGGHKIEDGGLYANLRNFPVSLAEGDMIAAILGNA